jgi:hypothetical protein
MLLHISMSNSSTHSAKLQCSQHVVEPRPRSPWHIPYKVLQQGIYHRSFQPTTKSAARHLPSTTDATETDAPRTDTSQEPTHIEPTHIRTDNSRNRFTHGTDAYIIAEIWPDIKYDIQHSHADRIQHATQHQNHMPLCSSRLATHKHTVGVAGRCLKSKLKGTYHVTTLQG